MGERQMSHKGHYLGTVGIDDPCAELIDHLLRSMRQNGIAIEPPSSSCAADSVSIDLRFKEVDVPLSGSGATCRKTSAMAKIGDVEAEVQNIQEHF